MKGSIRIAKVAGIPVFVHWTFSLFLLWILYMGKSWGMDWQALAMFATFMMTLFLCVILHEFGHALSARKYGVNTKDIILSPIGGVARLDKLPEKPLQEFIVAIAGPMVNVVIAVLIFIGLYLLTENGISVIGNERTFFNYTSNFFPLLFWLNITLVGFNMIPAFPMDGGRVLRSLLSMKIGRSKATKIASYIGQAVAVMFMFLGFYTSDLVIGIIGLFVFLMAAQENRMVQIESLLEGHFVSDILRHHFQRYHITDLLDLPIAEMKRGVEKNFLVLDETGNIAGVLAEPKLLEAAKAGQNNAPVVSYMSRNFEYIKPSDSLKDILNLFQSKNYSILPVIEDEQLIGVIDLNILNNFLSLQQKLK